MSDETWNMGDAIAEELAQERARTIEECAKVLDVMEDELDWPGCNVAKQAAARLRALAKEKPCEPAGLGLNVTGRAIHLSPSSLLLWYGCRQRWDYKEVERIPDPMNIYGANGVAVHAAIGAFHQARLDGKPITTREAIEIYAEKFRDWRRRIPEEEPGEDAPPWVGDRDSMRDRTIKALEIYFRDSAPAIKPKLVEQRLEVPLQVGEIHFLAVGRCDLVDMQGRAIDHKTVMKVPDWDGITEADEIQLLWYALLLEAVGEQAPPELRFDYLVASDRGAQVVPIAFLPTPEKLGRLRRLIEIAASEIVEGHVYPNPTYSLCTPRRCPYHDRCWKEWQ